MSDEIRKDEELKDTACCCEGEKAAAEGEKKEEKCCCGAKLAKSILRIVGLCIVLLLILAVIFKDRILKNIYEVRYSSRVENSIRAMVDEGIAGAPDMKYTVTFNAGDSTYNVDIVGENRKINFDMYCEYTDGPQLRFSEDIDQVRWERFKRDVAREVTADKAKKSLESTAKTTGETVKSTANDAKKSLESTAKTTGETVKSTANDAKKSLESTAKTTGETVKSTANDAKKSLESTAKTTGETVKSTANDAKKSLESTAKTTGETVKSLFNGIGK